MATSRISRQNDPQARSCLQDLHVPEEVFGAPWLAGVFLEVIRKLDFLDGI